LLERQEKRDRSRRERKADEPLIDGPKRRPTSLATAMSAGVRTSLSARITGHVKLSVKASLG